MEAGEAKEYRKVLSEVVKSEPDKAKRRQFLGEEKQSGEYKQARDIVINSRRAASSALGEEFEPIKNGDGENPLAEIQPSEETLSEDEKDLLWANRILTEYNDSVKSGNKHKAKEIVSFAARRLVKKTETIGRLAAVWKVDEESSEEDSAYNQILRRTYKEIKDNWDDLTHEQIAGLIKCYAHEEIGKDFVEQLLKAYFNGPSSRRQKVDAHYNFAFAALDLVNDQKAIDEVVRIGFFDTQIIPRGSEFHRDFILGRGTINDDQILSKAIIADNAIFNLSFLSTVDISDAQAANRSYVNTDPKIRAGLEKIILKASKMLGPKAARDRTLALMAYNEQDKLVLGDDEETAHVFVSTWPYSLLSKEKDPLCKRESLVISPLIVSKRLKKEFFDRKLAEKLGEFVQLSIPTPDGFMLDVAFPRSQIASKEDLVRHLLKNEQLAEDEKETVENMFREPVEKISLRVASFRGSPYIAWYRPLADLENLHPINALSEVGIPFSREDEDFANLGNALASEIIRTQIRFLNKRGVRVPLEFSEFKELGYKEIVFRAKGKNVHVEIGVLGNRFNIDLDENLNLEPGNRTISSGVLKDSLRYLILRTLRPVLCLEDFQDKVKGASLETEEVLSRMGHLRLLPEGFKFTDTAVTNFFLEQSKDLRVVNAERKIKLRTNRFTTYVKEVKEKEDNLPPVVINLPPEAF